MPNALARVPSRLDALHAAYGHLDGRALIEAMVGEFAGGIAVTSSFGAEAAVLLDLVAQVEPATPVIFLDTDALFDETVAYRDQLVRHLGLTELRVVRPRKPDIQASDELWRTDTDACCRLRKVLPMQQATRGFAALIDGRKGFHGGDRAALATISEGGDGTLKVSPLARWDEARVQQAFVERRLPPHPLVARGFRSIGCWPCTRAVAPGEPPRAGRWAGSGKTECGIHTFLGEGI